MLRVQDDASAAALAERLNAGARERPVVVVTTPSGQSTPWIDAAEIEQQVGELAEVVPMPTGSFTWSFSSNMPAMTQVFGGAGRVYPVGHAWASNPRLAPLRFAYSAAEGERATQQLIDDAMTMAAAAGWSAERATSRRTRLTGQVRGIVADRAIVSLETRQLGNVSPALAVPGVPIERVLVEHQALTGLYDEERRWFDVREMTVPHAEALGAYRVGDVVLAEVGEVGELEAELFLHPLVPVVVGRDEVTGNDRDDLRTLMTRSEVVAARVSAAGPQWRLSMLDVDDDEEPVAAVALLRGGPPWLTPPPDVPVPFEAPAPPPVVLTPAPTPAPDPAPTPVPAAPAARVDDAELRRLREDVDGYREEVRLLLVERTSAESRIAHLERQLADQRSRLRKAKRPDPARSQPVFADVEAGFRYAVLTAWASRTPLAEQETVPLPDYVIGRPFLASLDRLEGLGVAKVADVVFEVLTERAQHLAGRELHQYRESDGASSAPVSRDDGATLWRTNLQTNSASARRLHYWRLPGGGVELWHVGVHDERPPL